MYECSMNLKLALIQVFINCSLPNSDECQGKDNSTEESRAQLSSRWNLSPEYHLHHRDESAPIDLTVWNYNITIGHLYLFSNVSIRQFKGETFISTTKDTEMTLLTCNEHTCPVQHPTFHNLTADIVGASIDILHNCPQKRSQICHYPPQKFSVKNAKLSTSPHA